MILFGINPLLHDFFLNFSRIYGLISLQSICEMAALLCSVWVHTSWRDIVFGWTDYNDDDDVSHDNKDRSSKKLIMF